MLAWSGVFGLGAGAYFAGRSTPDDIPSMFLPWSFALALLLVPAMRTIGAAAWRRPPIAAVACLFGFLAMVPSLADTPNPLRQIDRLRDAEQPVLAEPAGQEFVAGHTRRGESVVILSRLGHRIGANLGVVNVSPYANNESMPTVEQLDEALAALREAGGDKVFLNLEYMNEEMLEGIRAAGFEHADEERVERTALLVDARTG